MFCPIIHGCEIGNLFHHTQLHYIIPFFCLIVNGILKISIKNLSFFAWMHTFKPNLKRIIMFYQKQKTLPFRAASK